MGDESERSRGSEQTCEECGTAGAEPLEVKYGDGNATTLVLCEECLGEYRAADLVDEMARLERAESPSGE